MKIAFARCSACALRSEVTQPVREATRSPTVDAKLYAASPGALVSRSYAEVLDLRCAQARRAESACHRAAQAGGRYRQDHLGRYRARNVWYAGRCVAPTAAQGPIDGLTYGKPIFMMAATRAVAALPLPCTFGCSPSVKSPSPSQPLVST